MDAIAKDLLWKAWPDGYLPMRGVSTVGGWQCVWPTGRGSAGAWIESVNNSDVADSSLAYWQQARERGDLLPNVDLSDTATWACLKDDLAIAVWGQTLPEMTFRYETADEENLAVFDLYGGFGARHRMFTFRLDSTESHGNEALGLVLARALVREKAENGG